MATGWLGGQVKEVVSGDTVVVQGHPRPGAAPPEKRITLSSLLAPKLARRDGSTKDEPFAWQAREFLRKKAVGQACTFRVDYTLDNIPGREFGSVFMGPSSAENLALSVVAAGFAKIRQAGGKQSPFYSQLEAAQAAAEASGAGLWTKDQAAIAAAVRDPAAEANAAAILAEHGKGQAVPAIVEQVPNGSTLRVTLLPSLQYVTVGLCGVSCPSMGRRPPAAEAKPDANGAAGGAGEAAAKPAAPAAGAAPAPATAAEAAASGPGGPAAAQQPEPWAREAKHFVEARALGKEVRLMLEGVDRFDNLFGRVMYAQGEAPVDLGEQLVKAGLGKAVNWGIEMMGGAGHQLREAERAAKQQKLAMWRNWVAPASAGTKLSDKFSGPVAEAVSGDCLLVRDSASGVERRVNLSSIRAPRIGRKGDKPEPYALEAKEFLRQRLIGREVSVAMEYNRQVPVGGMAAAEAAKAAGGQASTNDMAFATVTIREKDASGGGGMRDTNVAELLLYRGLATIVRHRTDDERSGHYEALMQAEQQGRTNRKGVHSNREAPNHHYNDVSQPGMAAKARQYLSFLQRNRQTAIVEYVLSGHRLKLYVPKEGVCIAFSPSGVRTPQRAMSGMAGRPQTQAEPFCEEAFAFTREHCLQREVEVDIETVDRGGTFLGRLRKSGGAWELGPALLAAGLAKLHPSFDAGRVQGGPELQQAQQKAQDARLKVWQDYDPAAHAEAADADTQANGHADEPAEAATVTVTEVVDGSTFYVQMAEEPRIAFIEEQLRDLSVSNGPAPRLQLGSLCIAQYSADGQWYRATVERVASSDPVNPKYAMRFVDFGNREVVEGRRVKAIEPALAAVPAQAHECTLAYLKVPSLDADYGMEAAQLLARLTGGGKKLSASIERKERLQQGPKSKGAPAHVLHVLLSDAGASSSSSDPESVNAGMLAAGVARVKVDKRSESKPAVAALLEAQAAAKKGHRGMWEYGDVDSDEDEAPARQPGAWGRR